MSLSAIRNRLAGRRAQLHALRTVVLCGGAGAEREVSLSSAANVAGALSAAGFNIQLLPVARDGISIDQVALDALSATAAWALPAGSTTTELSRDFGGDTSVERLRDAGIVFSTMHGRQGEDGVWQGLLELLQVPYVSAGVKGSALAFDKTTSKRLMEFFKVPTPRFWVQRRGAASIRGSVPADLQHIVAKPNDEGSSVGVRLLENDDAGWAAIAELNKHYDTLLIEERIFGAEVTCGVIGHAHEAVALPLVQVDPQGEFYDYRSKYTDGGSAYICPAAVPAALAARISEQSLLLYRELDLAPYARFDCIVDTLDEAWFLEVNTLPGFTQYSLLPKAAREAGVDFVELTEILMLCALERWEDKQ